MFTENTTNFEDKVSKKLKSARIKKEEINQKDNRERSLLTFKHFTLLKIHAFEWNNITGQMNVKKYMSCLVRRKYI